MNTLGSNPPHALVLGSGTSTGVPLIGCRCPVCTSTDPRDSRLRSGVYLTCGGFAAQLDVSPDFRQQALRFGIARLDAVFVTHPHADHIFGLDDVRRFNTIQNCRIPAYARNFTLGGLRRIFSYIAAPSPEQKAMYRPQIDFNEIGDASIEVGPFSVSSIEIPHGPSLSTAYKFETNGHTFVYAPDCSEMTDACLAFMRGADCVMLDGLRDRHHAGHLTINDSVEALRKANVKQGYITHLGHDVFHADLEKRLPANIHAAYDGLEVEW